MYKARVKTRSLQIFGCEAFSLLLFFFVVVSRVFFAFGLLRLFSLRVLACIFVYVQADCWSAVLEVSVYKNHHSCVWDGIPSETTSMDFGAHCKGSPAVGLLVPQGRILEVLRVSASVTGLSWRIRIGVESEFVLRSCRDAHEDNNLDVLTYC